MKRKGGYFLSRILAAILLLIFAAVVLLQIPGIQTKLTNFVADKLEENLQADISIGGMEFVPTSGLCLRDICVIDTNPYKEDVNCKGYAPQDTFAFIQSLRVTFKPSGLLGALGGKPIRMRRVTVEGGQMSLVIEPSDSKLPASNINRVFGLQPAEKKEPSEKEIFSIEKVVVRDFRFKMINFATKNQRKNSVGINWEDLDATVTIKGHDLRFEDGRMYGTSEFCEIREKSGFHAHNITGSTRVGRGETVIDGLLIKDDFSSISLPNFKMSYEGGFSDFVEKVGIHTDFGRSLVSFQTIKYFAGESMLTNFTLLDITQGRVDGPVADMQVKNLRFRDQSSKMYGVIDRCRIDGLPSIKETVFDFGTSGINFTPNSLSVFIGNFAKGQKLNLPPIIPGITYSLSGVGLGTLNDLKLDIALNSMAGLIKVNGKLADILSPAPIRISGEVVSPNLEAGQFIGGSILGTADLSAFVDLNLANGTTIDIRDVKVNSIETRWHTFRDIAGKANISGGRIEASLNMEDSGLKGNLGAVIDNGQYAAKGRIDDAELMYFGVVKETYRISSDIDADIKSLVKDGIEGYVVLDDFHFQNALANKEVGRMAVRAHATDSCQTITFDAPFAKAAYEGTLENFDAYLDVHDKNQVFNSIIPEIFISDETRINVSRKDTVRVEASITSPRIGYSDINLKDLSLGVSAEDERFGLELKGTSFGISEGLKFDNPEFRLKTVCHHTENDGIHIVTEPETSFLAFGTQKWSFDDVDVLTEDKDVKINSFKISNEDQEIRAAGSVKDSLRVTLEKLNSLILLDIMDADPAMADIIRKTGGKASGFIEYLGSKGRISAQIDGIANNTKTLSAGGLVDLKQKYMDTHADINNFDLAMASPFLQDLFSEMGGSLRGNVKAKGKFDDLDIRSDSLILDKARLKLAFTQTAYTLDGPITVDKGKISMDKTSIRDDFGGSANLDASLDLSNLKKAGLDVMLRFKNLRLISLKEEESESFYGTVNASGLASVKGPFNSLKIMANAETSDKGNIHIPLGGGANATDGKILKFLPRIEDVDEYEMIQKRKNAEKKGNIDIKASLKVKPDLLGYVEINKSQGHVLKVAGAGDLTMEMNTAKQNINLGGDFNITQGNYHFVALETVAQRDFTIDPGSSIRLNGKPLDTEFDITACYKLKASLAPLTMDTTSVTSRRLVNCKLNLSNNLANPQMKFAIEIPDLDPTTSSVVQSMLNTEEKVQKQFVSLLVTGTFLPGEESGVYNNTGSAFVFNSISTFVSGQLNTILQSLNIPVDMGLNYQNSQGKDMFDVAVSTQLFDNRVEVNGSVGNRQNSGQKSDVVGDIDIEVKLNKQGNIRVKAFSHSADDYTNFLDNTQRSGLGFSFQTEFGKAKLEKRMKVIEINE